MGPEYLALHQQRVDQGGLAVIDVGYDGQVTYGVVLEVGQIYSPTCHDSIWVYRKRCEIVNAADRKRVGDYAGQETVIQSAELSEQGGRADFRSWCRLPETAVRPGTGRFRYDTGTRDGQRGGCAALP